MKCPYSTILSFTAASIGKLLRGAAFTSAVLGAALLFGAQAASAETQIFKDILRPHGVERSLAQKFADGHRCGATANNTFTNAAAFQKCMRARGWALDHTVPDAPASPSTWIDPDTGMECHSAGIAAVCVPPQGTVTYTNKHGYPCKRTGIVSVCGNL
jgi:hypothetical protein